MLLNFTVERHCHPSLKPSPLTHRVGTKKSPRPHTPSGDITSTGKAGLGSVFLNGEAEHIPPLAMRLQTEPGTQDLNSSSVWSVTTPQPPQGWHGCSEGTGQQEGCIGRAEHVSGQAAGSAGVLLAGEQHSSSCQLLPQLLHPGSSQSRS